MGLAEVRELEKQKLQKILDTNLLHVCVIKFYGISCGLVLEKSENVKEYFLVHFEWKITHFRTRLILFIKLGQKKVDLIIRCA